MRDLTLAAVLALFATPVLALGTDAVLSDEEPATGEEIAADGADQLLRASYLCEDGARFDTVYVNTAAGNYAVLGLGDRLIRLMPAVSASGARYLSHPGENPDIETDMYYQLWSKGPEATLTVITPGEDGAEDVEEDIFLACAEDDLSDIDLTARAEAVPAMLDEDEDSTGDAATGGN